MKIKYFTSFKDNYIWLIQRQNQAFIVDPGQSHKVIDYIIANNLEISAILVTHSHPDHILGIDKILQYKQVPVYNNLNPINNDNIKIISTPGHTNDGVSYLVENKHLFCGDTLFASGCGRVANNNYLQMLQSLQTIKNLNANTLIYPAHEYAFNNLQFSHKILPTDNAIKQRLDNITPLPTTLELELKTNLFLRCNEKIVQNAVAKITNSQIYDELSCFTLLRQLKDTF